MGNLDIIVGKIVQSLAVAEGEETLRIWTDKGNFELTTFADCCSETWFAVFNGVEFLLGEEVLAVREMEEGKVPVDVYDGKTRQEEDQAYGYEIDTRKGTAQLIFRNSSNGYYGGSMSVQEGFINTGVEFREILSDWEA